METKVGWQEHTAKTIVLIEPLWDGNFVFRYLLLGYYVVLIEPLWDGNLRPNFQLPLEQFVLIEPLWDGNEYGE
ncbi:hypothetical protein JDF658_01150 [Carboxydocella sp. JDF658]|nr:hypothetical protein JDF658_01150 [Carboxydocella sp. JDF658]